MNIFKKSLRIFSYVVIGFGLVGFILCACSSDKLEVNNYSYKNTKLKDDTIFKAAVISDFHHRDLEFSNTNMIDAINNLDKDTDAIFFTGDLIDSHVKSLDNANKIFKACKDNMFENLYFVTGNHEEYASMWPELRDSFTANNVKFIDNKMDALTFEDKNVCIYGLMDPRFDLHTYKNGRIEYGKSKEYLDSFNIDKTKVNILLAHRPELIDLYSQYNFDYILSGHSHGGQFRIGNWTPLNIAFKGKTYPRGEYKQNNSTMIVSAGLGHSAMFPLRINCNPEIVTISISK